MKILCERRVIHNTNMSEAAHHHSVPLIMHCIHNANTNTNTNTNTNKY